MRLQHGLAGHHFDKEMDDDWLIMDALVVLRVSRPDGETMVQVFNTAGTDTIIQAGLLQAASDLRHVFYLEESE